MDFPQSLQLPDGWRLAINSAILDTTTVPGGGALPSLLDGRPKALVVQWKGLLVDPDDFLPYRGDGRWRLHHGEDAERLVPPNLPAGFNIRASVPLWLVAERQGRVLVLACGGLHPLFNAATVDHFHPVSGKLLDRSYIWDPRVEPHSPPDGWVSPLAQRHAIHEAGGQLKATDGSRPPGDPVMLSGIHP